MTAQHFLLKWNNHQSNLINVFESLLQLESLVDVTLSVEGKFIKAHRIVLSACSPYFQNLFNNINEKYPIIIFHDISYNHLKILLEFMYRGEISIDEADLSDVLKVAENLNIRGLSSFDDDDDNDDNNDNNIMEQQQQQQQQQVETNGILENKIEIKEELLDLKEGDGGEEEEEEIMMKPKRKRRLKKLKQPQSPIIPPIYNQPIKQIRRRLTSKKLLTKFKTSDESNSEPLSEMSVRGLDLFKYASVESGIYKCNECEKLRIPKTFKNKYSFQRHAFLYHEGNMRKVFPCSVCSREFSRPDKMKNHLRSVHREIVNLN